MVKLIYCLKRQPHLSREAFLAYWLNTHGPLVREHAAAMKVRRYIQTHTTDEETNEAIRASRGSPEGFDGVAELWFESREEMREGASTPEGRAGMRLLREDEARFIDQANSPAWIGEEKKIVDD